MQRYISHKASRMTILAIPFLLTLLAFWPQPAAWAGDDTNADQYHRLNRAVEGAIAMKGRP